MKRSSRLWWEGPYYNFALSTSLGQPPQSFSEIKLLSASFSILFRWPASCAKDKLMVLSWRPAEYHLLVRYLRRRRKTTGAYESIPHTEKRGNLEHSLCAACHHIYSEIPIATPPTFKRTSRTLLQCQCGGHYLMVIAALTPNLQSELMWSDHKQRYLRKTTRNSIKGAKFNCVLYT